MQFHAEHNGRGGFRFNVVTPPAVGTKFLNPFRETVVFDEVGIAGMLVCSGPNGQSLYMPQQLSEIPNGDGNTDTGPSKQGASGTPVNGL